MIVNLLCSIINLLSCWMSWRHISKGLHSYTGRCGWPARLSLVVENSYIHAGAQNSRMPNKVIAYCLMTFDLCFARQWRYTTLNQNGFSSLWLDLEYLHGDWGKCWAIHSRDAATRVRRYLSPVVKNLDSTQLFGNLHADYSLVPFM